jgi:hypothetical protein
MLLGPKRLNTGTKGDFLMRISCCAYSYRQALQSGDMTLPDFLQTCQEIGFDGVELTAYYFPTTERAFLNEIWQSPARRLATTLPSQMPTSVANTSP